MKLWVKTYGGDAMDMLALTDEVNQLRQHVFCGTALARAVDEDREYFRMTVYSTHDISSGISSCCEWEEPLSEEELHEVRLVAACRAVSLAVNPDLIQAFGDILLSKRPELRAGSPTPEEAIIAAGLEEYESDFRNLCDDPDLITY